MMVPLRFLTCLSLVVSCGGIDTNQNQIANTETVISLTIPDVGIVYESTTLSLHIREGEDLESSRQIYTQTQYRAEDASIYQILAEPGKSYIAHITYHLDGDDVASTRYCGALTNIISNVATGINHYNPRICLQDEGSSADVIRSPKKNSNPKEHMKVYTDATTGEDLVILSGDSAQEYDSKGTDDDQSDDDQSDDDQSDDDDNY